MPTILEDYFDFSDPDEIRIEGHRVWLHHILLQYRDHTVPIEQLFHDYASLSKDEILACILYYHRNQTQVDEYLDRLKEIFRKQREDSIRRHGNWLAELQSRQRAATTQAVE